MTLDGAWSATRSFVGVIVLHVARDGSAFFMVVLPVAIIMIIGSTFGGAAEIEIAVVGEGPEAASVAAALDELDTVRATSAVGIESARQDLRRFDIEAAVVVDGDLATRGVDIIVNDASDGGFAARSLISRTVDQLVFAPPRKATPVSAQLVGEEPYDFSGGGPFALSAAQNLVLFTFINSLTSAAIVVRAGREGILRRSLAAPVGAGALVFGIGAGWFVLALAQSLIILLVGALAFGVPWGDPVGAVALVGSFALVGTGAGLLVGAVMTSEDQTTAVTPPLGLVLAALGGCMVPIEIFSDSLLVASRLTPHYWALEGWKTLIFRDGDLSDVADSVLVLVAAAGVLLIGAAFALRRRLTGVSGRHRSAAPQESSAATT